jgi:hypothetical protein
LPAQLVIAALGFRTPSLGAGTPYDERRGVVPAGSGGRVFLKSSSSSSSDSSSSSSDSSSDSSPPPPLQGLYVTGWARRGPTGIIGENLRDAAEVADAVASDAAALMHRAEEGKEEVGKVKKDSSSSSLSSSNPDLLSLLLSSSSRQPRVVDVEGWAKIDALAKEGAAREVDERRDAREKRKKKKNRKGGGGEGDSSSDSPPRVKILSAEELLRAAGV